MRIYEIASAEDQIALFKLITDKVWQALGDQQRAEVETKASQPLKAKLKPISPKKSKPQAARQHPSLRLNQPHQQNPNRSQCVRNLLFNNYKIFNHQAPNKNKT